MAMRIFLSFLGRGSIDHSTGRFRYRPTRYRFDGVPVFSRDPEKKISSETAFVQAAEMELLGGGRFAKVVLALTETSRREHYGELCEQLRLHGVDEVIPIMIDESSFSADTQWKWFEEILRVVEPGSLLTVDLTHGYRMIPILFSTATHFFQRARGVTLEAAYYGAYDAQGEIKPIVDLKEFYAVNLWADAVGRLVDEADAGALAEVAAAAPGFQAGALADRELLTALTDLTASVKNVEIHGVGIKAAHAIRLIETAREKAGSIDRLLLDLIAEKFSRLVGDSGDRYDRAYFDLQLTFIRLLAKHGLYMQCFTALWELVGSIGLLGLEEVSVRSASGRKKRNFHAEVFKSMVRFPRSKWEFTEGQSVVVDQLVNHYDRLDALGIVDCLRGETAELVRLRNGFDHAWCGAREVPPDMQSRAEGSIERIQKIVEGLFQGVAPSRAASPNRFPLVFSHRLTAEQERDARERWGEVDCLYLPEELQKLWSQLSPEGPLPEADLDAVACWAEAHSSPGGPVLVQGDFGATAYVVRRLQEAGRAPVYATTHREAVESLGEDGSVRLEHVFRHVAFREYPS